MALMPIVPLGKAAYRRTDGITPEVRLVNMYLEKDESGLSPDGTLRVQRPGLAAPEKLGMGPIRGIDFRASGERMAVSGNNFYANARSVGLIDGLGVVSMVGTAFAHAVLGGTRVSLYTTSLVALPMPDNRPVQDIDQINGYVILLTPTGRYYWLEPGSAAVDALNFATAESAPDGAVAVRRLVDEFWIFGASTVEVWQSTGNPDAPFQRASGRLYERGCLFRDTVRRFDNSLMWVGDDGNVYRGGAVPQAVSDNGIAERIRSRTGDCSAWVFGVDNHEFYALRIPGQGTFVYDASTQTWCEFASSGKSEWRAWVGIETPAGVYAGSVDSGEIWRVTPDAVDDAGTMMERTVSATVPVPGKPARNDSFAIGTGASADCVVQLRWKDGQEDYPVYAEDLDVRQGIDVTTLYRLGMPDQPYRTFEVSCRDKVRIRFSGAQVNDAWR